MGYTTSFSGGLTIKPRLPDEYVKLFNEIAGKRNNSYGDGDEGSFDHLMFGNLGRPGPSALGLEGPTGVPACWCQWELDQDAEHTLLQWDGGEKFYEYAKWLAFCLAVIKKDFPRSKFEGTIEWQGEDDNDVGRLSLSEGGTVIEQPGEKEIYYHASGQPVEAVRVLGLKSFKVKSQVVMAKLG